MNDLMNSIRHGADAFTNGMVTVFFDWLVSIGVREETLNIILIGGGISFVILIVGGIAGIATLINKKGMINFSMPSLPNFSLPKRQKRPKAAKGVIAEKVKGPDPRFAIFKKRRARNKFEDEPQPVMTQDNSVHTLQDIERDMLALKELYEASHITVDVYVAETRKLYQKAQQYI